MQQKISIFGEIRDSTADTVAYQMDNFDRSLPILVELNSNGGDVSAGIAIYNLLRTWPAGCVVEVVGWALSIASVILMAGTTRRAHETSLLMVHAPWIDTKGNAEGLRGTAELLDQVSKTMSGAYLRTGQPEAVIATWLDGSKDRWFTAREALALELVTEIIADALQETASPANAQAMRHRVPPQFQAQIFSRSNQMPQPTPQNQGVDAESIRAAAIQAEAQRRNDISAMFAKPIARGVAGAVELQAQCERDINCTPQAAGMKILDLYGRDSAPIGGRYVPDVGGGRGPEFNAAATDMLLARAGFKVAEPHPGSKDLKRRSIVGLAEDCLSMAGRSYADMAPAAVISAALSTSDFPLLLANVAHKAMAMGYQNSPSGHARFSAEREVANFRPQTLVSLSEAPSLEKVAELGEYRAGNLSDGQSQFTLETFGRVIYVSRQALINDDLDAFARVPNLFGVAARRQEADKVFALLTANAVMGDGIALFHANHGNLGSAAAPSVESLGAARASMRKQRGLAGLDFVDIQPRYLIVPAALETECEQLIASLLDPRGMFHPSMASNVEFIRGLELVADPRLDVSSETAWYLAADPQKTESIIRAYLAGEDRPHLEESTEFKRDVIAWKVRLDFACGVQDYRGLYKNPGA